MMMNTQEFSAYLEKLEKTASRLTMTEILADFFSQVDLASVQSACYLLQGGLVPQYQSLEFQLSEKMILRALARVESFPPATTVGSADLFGQVDTNQELVAVTQLYKESGDLGQTAQKVLALRKSKTELLSLLTFFQALKSIALESGQGSQERKLLGLIALLKQVDPLTARYVVRIILGKMRLGFSVATILDALSWVFAGDKSLSPILERAYQKRADIGLLAKEYLTLVRQKVTEQTLIDFLQKQKVLVGVPVMPALCQRLNSAGEIIDKLGEVIAEPKYDGLRLQIHYWRDAQNQIQIKAFSRSLDDMTRMFPELTALAKNLTCQACILDSEAIGFNPQTHELKTFQETITRKRKHDIGERVSTTPIKFFVFDLLALDEQSLIDLPLNQRRKLLIKVLTNSPVAEVTQAIKTNDPQLLHQFHEKMLAQKLEGAVIKKADSSYISGRKGWRWVKIKESEGTTGKLNDTLDLVVMGYYSGKGKRAQFGLGAILVGILDNQDEILSISKIGTGMTEDLLGELKRRADQLAVKTRPPLYQMVDKSLEPDVWLEPGLVVEVAADEITRSPAHQAGVALRFPRLVKIRDDKDWSAATTVAELSDLKI